MPTPLRQGGPSWKLAESDGWVPGENLLPIADAAAKGTVIMYLLSDAGQKHSWDTIKGNLAPGNTLYFSHGFAVTYAEDTGVVPPDDVDVFLCAPKGSGTTVRSLFLEGERAAPGPALRRATADGRGAGRGINSSVAIFQDVTGNARERAFALGVSIGSGCAPAPPPLSSARGAQG